MKQKKKIWGKKIKNGRFSKWPFFQIANSKIFL
jgi:hypothetical protein